MDKRLARWKWCLHLARYRIKKLPQSSQRWLVEVTVSWSTPITSADIEKWYRGLETSSGQQPPHEVAPYPLCAIPCRVYPDKIGQAIEVLDGLKGIMTTDHGGSVLLPYWSMRSWLRKQGYRVDVKRRHDEESI